jgi:hypothetical protein
MGAEALGLLVMCQVPSRLLKKTHMLRCAQSARSNVPAKYASARRFFARLASEIFLSSLQPEFFGDLPIAAKIKATTASLRSSSLYRCTKPSTFVHPCTQRGGLSTSGQPLGWRPSKMRRHPARALGLKLRSVTVRGLDDCELGFRAAINERASGLLIRGAARSSAVHRRRLVELPARNRLPTPDEKGD